MAVLLDLRFSSASGLTWVSPDSSYRAHSPSRLGNCGNGGHEPLWVFTVPLGSPCSIWKITAGSPIPVGTEIIHGSVGHSDELEAHTVQDRAISVLL